MRYDTLEAELEHRIRACDRFHAERGLSGRPTSLFGVTDNVVICRSHATGTARRT